MAAETEELALTRRRLILRDSFAFLSLTLTTVILFGVTLFLFKSFMAHRAELATRWSERGRQAMAQGKAEQAVVAYRTALSYAPDEHADELMLAGALGAAGRTEEAYNYFMELWEQRPGDGSINLQLARLNAKKRDVQGAINSYRASIYGTWEGDGVERRREVRLELAQYLIAQHEPGAAKNELLIAGGNAPETAAIEVTLAALLEQAGDPTDALNYYEKALAKEPRNEVALRGAGRLAFTLGDYPRARKLLVRASRDEGAWSHEDAALLDESTKILQLEPNEMLPVRERVTRILADRELARRRLDECEGQQGSAAGAPASALQALNVRWAGADGLSSRAVLMQDEDRQAAALQLVYDTELATSQLCTAPAGDDALLSLLAKAAAARDR